MLRMANSADAVTAALQRELLFFFFLWLALLTGGGFFGAQINANSHDVPLLIMESHLFGFSPPPMFLAAW